MDGEGAEEIGREVRVEVLSGSLFFYSSIHSSFFSANGSAFFSFRPCFCIFTIQLSFSFSVSSMLPFFLTFLIVRHESVYLSV